MWHRMRKKIGLKKLNILIWMLCVVFIASCGRSEDSVSGDSKNCVYYLNREETKIVAIEDETLEIENEASGKTPEELIAKAMERLQSDPEDPNLKKTLGGEVTIDGYSLENGVLLLDFGRDYYALSNTTEVLFRAALVRTLTAIEGVDSVSINVENMPLTNTNGFDVGLMKAEDFIDNAGEEMNAYEETTLTLYFATADGTHLSKEVREVEYSSNISKEKLVLEQLIAGPSKKDLGPTIAPERKINSVTTKDGICYVNLGDLSIDALSLVGSIAEDVSIYSIVNSLCELPNVNKVQIAIDGETDRLYRESFPLDKVYERNLDIMEK